MQILAAFRSMIEQVSEGRYVLSDQVIKGNSADLNLFSDQA